MSIWGKIIGGTAGFALGGPIGAILGAMAGHSFDKRSHNQKNSYFNIPNSQKQNIYVYKKQTSLDIDYLNKS